MSMKARKLPFGAAGNRGCESRPPPWHGGDDDDEDRALGAIGLVAAFPGHLAMSQSGT
jgi:hypothetical protein